LSPGEILILNGVLDSVPPKWRAELKTNNEVFRFLNPLDQPITLRLNENTVPLLKITSKQLYWTFVTYQVMPPTAQFFYQNKFQKEIPWSKVYTLPAKCCLDTKTREFQYKVLHNIVFTRALLHKIGKSDTPLCSFCKTHDENLDHLLFKCNIIQNFWKNVINWLTSFDIKEWDLNEMSVILGIIDPNDDYILINHIILLAKYFIYKCSLFKILPTVCVYTQN